MLIRLDKYLADAGYGTRSAVQELLHRSRVRVNGQVIKDGKYKIDTDSDRVELNGKEAGYEKYSYYILNKPAGILSAARDKKEKTVIDLVPEPHPRDLFPVGRLDKDTVGLLLITNDGELGHRLLAPGKHVPKTYRVIVKGDLPEDAEERFQKGIDIGDDKPTAPAGYMYCGLTDERALSDMLGVPALTVQTMKGHGRITEEHDKAMEECPPEERSKAGEVLHEIRLTLTEGRYHEVKRMVAALGCEVTGLERISMGGLELPQDLSRGEARRITSEEMQKLLPTTGDGS